MPVTHTSAARTRAAARATALGVGSVLLSAALSGCVPTPGGDAKAPPSTTGSRPLGSGSPAPVYLGDRYAACADGACRVVIEGPVADIPVRGLVLHASVTVNTVVLHVDSPGNETTVLLGGPTGTTTLRINGSRVGVRLHSVAHGRAVLDIVS